MTDEKLVRVIVNLHESVVQQLEEIPVLRGALFNEDHITRTSAIEKAIVTYRDLMQKQLDGTAILLGSKTGIISGQLDFKGQ